MPYLMNNESWIPLHLLDYEEITIGINFKHSYQFMMKIKVSLG
jgi:hypothetical protein